MTLSKNRPALRQTVIAMAVLAAFGQQARADDDVAALTKPESSVSVGMVAANGTAADRAVFGQYTGLRNNDVHLKVDFDYLTRDDATGAWTMARGANLGLDTGEFGIGQEKQGDWKYSLELGQLTRVNPRTVNTGMSGFGTTTPTIARIATPGSGTDQELKTERRSAQAMFEKWISPSLQFEGNIKEEQKSGARLWGRGYDCAAYVCGSSTTTAINQGAFVKNALLLLPEPIDSHTTQIDGRLNYRNEKWLVSVGYYGSFYNNSNGSLNPTVPNLFNNGLGQPFPGYPAVTGAIIAGGGMSLQNVLQTPMALPPDNQAHQLFVDGNYAYSPKTKFNFKLAYTHATQNDNFLANGLTGAPAGRSDLGARLDTTLAQVGFTARPLEKLSVLGNVRYEHKEDKTPQALYNLEPNAVVPATNPVSYTNVNSFWNNNSNTSTKVAGKLEASYRLPANVRGTLGVDYSSIEREVPTSITDDKVAGLGALREKNRETTYRAELRRSMSETLNGAISYSTAKRTGSDWTTLSTLNPATPGISAANLALINMYCGGVACYGQQLPASSILGMSATTPFPLSQTDLTRDKWKLSLDWNPLDRFSMQLVVEDGRDKNDAPFNPVVGGKGWQNTAVKLYSLDASYAFTESVSMIAFASHGDQTQLINHSTGYMANLNDRNDTVGLGLTAKPSSRLAMGANLSFINDVNRYSLLAASSTSGTLPGALTAVAPSAANVAQAAGGLPDASYKQLALKLFGTYAVSKKSDVRVDLIHSRIRFNEWTWGYNGVPFVYADNTTVNMQSVQNVTFAGITFISKF